MLHVYTLICSSFTDPICLYYLQSIQRRVNTLQILRKADSPTANSDTERGDDFPSCSVGVLFSGGIDSVLLSAVLHTCLPPDEPIDLINVTFDGTIENSSDDTSFALETSSLEIEPLRDEAILDSTRSILGVFKASGDLFLMQTIHIESSRIIQRCRRGKHYCSSSRSPDRLAAFAALIELRSIFPSRVWRLICVDVNSTERLLHEERVKSLILVRRIISYISSLVDINYFKCMKNSLEKLTWI
jgi:hypothetical protein